MEKVQLIRDRRRELEFQVDDWVFLKVSPIKGVMRFGKKGKLCPLQDLEKGWEGGI